MRLFIVMLAVVLGLAFSLTVAYADEVTNEHMTIAGVFMITCGVVSKLINRGYLFNRRKQQQYTPHARRATDYSGVDNYYAQHGKDAWGTGK